MRVVIFHFQSTQLHLLLPLYPAYSLTFTLSPKQGCLAHQMFSGLTFSHLLRPGFWSHISEGSWITAYNQIESPRMIGITLLRSWSHLHLPILPQFVQPDLPKVLTGYLTEPSLLSQISRCACQFSCYFKSCYPGGESLHGNSVKFLFICSRIQLWLLLIEK